MGKRLEEMTMEDLWRLFPVTLVPYDPKWPAMFETQRRQLQEAFPDARIRHIGSTAVPGLIAKPCVDILLETGICAAAVEETAAALGWRKMSDRGKGQFNKGYTPDGFAEEVFHLHVRAFGDHDEPYFSSYLIRHPDTAAQYAALKRALTERFRYDRDAYTANKSAFVAGINKLAREEGK